MIDLEACGFDTRRKRRRNPPLPPTGNCRWGDGRSARGKRILYSTLYCEHYCFGIEAETLHMHAGIHMHSCKISSDSGISSPSHGDGRVMESTDREQLCRRRKERPQDPNALKLDLPRLRSLPVSVSSASFPPLFFRSCLGGRSAPHLGSNLLLSTEEERGDGRRRVGNLGFIPPPPIRDTVKSVPHFDRRSIRYCTMIFVRTWGEWGLSNSTFLLDCWRQSSIAGGGM